MLSITKNFMYTTQKQLNKTIDFKAYLSEKLKDKQFKKHYDDYGKRLEVAYKILQMRKNAGISQTELARKIGTKQSNVVRMESGSQNFTTQTLQKIADVFGCALKIEFVK
ncbi:MAG: transcriptional regulator [Candidatus Nealsonbacteria bacterium CG08_land_8_20_14_0_20_43_11]|uniref:Transcriptional regulator n=1 Tax=Candidatus Nealsonbacteria bacterium CG08_land_8_20_14_0_20_43_11 TaxID=1974706 RepID=A0A2M6T1A0_9BACT|nr:MAG: transcriptional regulator [Candidatus Nealsonbacteria bacterium CG08_land_8_20_14_0_20_43_11]